MDGVNSFSTKAIFMAIKLPYTNADIYRFCLLKFSRQFRKTVHNNLREDFDGTIKIEAKFS